MTIPDPPWKQKTRPCPFYSQGRCLFSDSCNFLHDVKIRVKQPNITITDSTPDVIISSPQTSSVVASPTTRNVSVRSPPRSPRLSSLLLALGDAIQTDEEDDSVDSFPPLTLPSNAIVPYSRTPNDDLHSEELKNEDSGLPAPPDNDESEVENEVIQEVAQTPSADGSARSEPSDLLSPIEVKLAPAFLGQLDGPSHREDSIDSGYADNWTGPLPFALSPPKPTSSRRYSTLSLLSSPFGSPVRALSPKFGPSAVSAWPSSPIFSPVMSRAGSRPSSLRLSQAFDDLDSPTDYHRGQLSAGSPSIASPEIDEDVTIRRSLPAASDEAVVEKTVVPANKSLDKTITSAPKRLPERAIPEPSMDVIEEAACTEPVVPHAEVNAESSNPSRSKDSLLEEDTSALYSSYYSEALYTNSPRNVELFSSSPVVSSTSPHPVTSPTPSVPRSSSREFDVPEFVTGSSKDVYYEKPSIAPTPVRSALSLSSPRIISPRVSSRQSSVEKEKEAPAQVSQSASTKVPFGFRYSLAHSRESTTSRPGSAPPTRHRPPALIGLSSGRSQSLNDNPQISPEEPLSSSKSSSRLRPLRLSMLLNSSTPSLLSSTSSNVFPAVTASSFTDYSQHSSPSVKSDHSLSQDHMLSNTHSERIPHRNSTIAISTTSQSLEYSYQPHSLPLSAPPINHPPASWNNATQSSHRISSRLTYISRPSSRLSERIPQPSIQEDEPSVFSHTNIRTFEGGEDSPSGLHEPSTNDTVLVHSLALHTSSSPSPQLQERSPLSRPITTAPASPPASHAISSLSPPSEQQSILPRHQSLAAATITSALPETQIAPQAIPSPSTHPEQRISIHRNPPQSLSRPVSVVSSLPHSPVHAIATPRPTLIFAIASDDPAEVRRVLESGEASPNDDVGPQSALAFALTSGQLKHRTEIVKLLLAYGANPASVKTMGSEGVGGTQTNYPRAEDEEGYVERDFEEEVKRKSVNPLDAADPATRYYISRAEAPQTRRASALIHRSFFRPLTKVRYEMVGQDRALEQLFRVLSMPSLAPIVVLLCGPSGHGKSLLARRFGSLLDVPTHTVNMTTLRSTHDIWRSYSMSPYEEPSSLTLADFLMENEGKRCVVVLDEIEKTENDTILSSLLMPWELGRCSFEAGHRHVNVSKVIWLGTSNIGHDLVFEHHSSRVSPAEPMTRDEYVDLMGILRPVVSDRLGPSLLSRVTTVLPFVPFTNDEKLAIAAEALFSLAEDAAIQLPAATVEKLVKDSLHSYVPAEGARSLYRAVSAQLLETL